ncbi:MAG TPA: aldehyde dehydrogenase family protein [Candidatus Sulfotelmatobacter sp.]|nr:aldehyde dehydrogenase family protein [Candidatus Sulfotelmatobacter sp.]
MRTVQSFVQGKWCPGNTEIADINPAQPATPVAQLSLANRQVAEQAVKAAVNAGAAWRNTPAPARGEILRKAADLLQQRTPDVARDLAMEEGKTLPEAAGETGRAVAILRYFAAQTLEPDGETYPSHSSRTFLYAVREPIGTVAAITPWNFPIAIPVWKIAPALAFGNTVVWKPAEIVPLTATHLVQALADAGLPAGVLNLVLGRGSDVGDAITTHPDIDAITFTGSNKVGRAIQAKAVALGKKVQLELGGKNPAVVLADADLDIAADQIARGAFLSAGQKCTATSRVIVDQKIWNEFRQKLVDRTTQMTLGDPLDAKTKVGPVSSEQQFKTVRQYLEIAQKENAKFLTGEMPGADGKSGFYIPPIILEGLSTQSALVREEVFGPVAALLPARDPDEALKLANDTPFGLSASVFTNDLNRAMQFVRGLRAGVVKVNQETAGLEFQVPFGGMGDSSSGSREQGKVARDFFTQWKTVYIDSF